MGRKIDIDYKGDEVWWCCFTLFVLLHLCDLSNDILLSVFCFKSFVNVIIFIQTSVKLFFFSFLIHGLK